MKQKIINSIKQSNCVKTTKTSFKKVAAISALDLVYYLIMLGLTIAFLVQVAPVVDLLGNAQMLMTDNFDNPEIDSQLAALESGLVKIQIASVLFGILILVAFALLKGLIWAMITKQKPSKSYFLRFAVIALILYATFFLLNTLLSQIIIPMLFPIISLIIIAPLFIHLMNLSYAILPNNNSIKITLKNIFKIGFGKIHLFIIPYIIIFISFAIFLGLIGLLNYVLPSILYTIVFFIVMMLFISYSRIYIYNVIQKITGDDKIIHLNDSKPKHKTIKKKK